jgi:protein-S-isoprenylcysteine O-methyltransferase Ste14
MKRPPRRSAALSLVLIVSCGSFAYAASVHGYSDWVVSGGVLLISWTILGLFWRRRRDDDQ